MSKRVPGSERMPEAGRRRSSFSRRSEPYWESCVERKKIETLFAEAKQILSMVRPRLRGLAGVRDELLLTATVRNPRRLASHIAGPPPQPTMA